jgi:hypothetical protein
MCLSIRGRITASRLYGPAPAETTRISMTAYLGQIEPIADAISSIDRHVEFYSLAPHVRGPSRTWIKVKNPKARRQLALRMELSSRFPL